MARPTSKDELIVTSACAYGKLKEFIASMTGNELGIPLDSSTDKGKERVHWSRDKNSRDALTRLHEWHRLLLDWVGANISGKRRPFVPELYT